MAENVLTAEFLDRAKEALMRPRETSANIEVWMSREAYAALPDPDHITIGDLLELMQKGLL